MKRKGKSDVQDKLKASLPQHRSEDLDRRRSRGRHALAPASRLQSPVPLPMPSRSRRRRFRASPMSSMPFRRPSFPCASQSRANPVSDEAGNGFSFDFGGRGFDELPDDHPLKRFFTVNSAGQNGAARRRAERDHGPRDGKPAVCARLRRAPASSSPKTAISSPTTTSFPTAPPSPSCSMTAPNSMPS